MRAGYQCISGLPVSLHISLSLVISTSASPCVSVLCPLSLSVLQFIYQLRENCGVPGSAFAEKVLGSYARRKAYTKFRDYAAVACCFTTVNEIKKDALTAVSMPSANLLMSISVAFRESMHRVLRAIVDQ